MSRRQALAGQAQEQAVVARIAGRAVPVGCRLTMVVAGRIGPTVGDPTYLLAVDGDLALLAASYDIASWPDRVHRRALALAAAVSGPDTGTSS